jgi:polysaccharide biosynthesis protein PelA
MKLVHWEGGLNVYRYWIVAVLIIGCTIAISDSIFAAYQAKSPLYNVSDYKIYYGEINQQIIEQFGNYDMVIIEPHATTKEQITEIKDSGTITLGYISIMELETWNKEFVQKVLESDYYYTNNKKIYIEEWDTHIMDISNSHYRQIILEEIAEEILAKGFDGIFLDTAGDIDDYFDKQPEELQKLRNGYVTLLKDIEKLNNKLLLVQNWGFDTYKHSTYPYIDGILWEGFDKNRLENLKWGQNWIKYFKEQEKDRKLAVFTVSRNNTGKKYSEKYGFVSYINKNSIYNDWLE